MKMHSKKAVIVIMVAVILILAVGLTVRSVKPITTDDKSSELYSQEEIESAVACVREDFKSLHGCKLYSLSYAGDE